MQQVAGDYGRTSNVDLARLKSSRQIDNDTIKRHALFQEVSAVIP
jgi:hypothetical protein